MNQLLQVRGVIHGSLCRALRTEPIGGKGCSCRQKYYISPLLQRARRFHAERHIQHRRVSINNTTVDLDVLISVFAESILREAAEWLDTTAVMNNERRGNSLLSHFQVEPKGK